MALRPGQRVRLRDADAEFEMRLRSVPASCCPACFIRLPLSGEPNCDCEPANAAQWPVSAPQGHEQAETGQQDTPAPDSAPEPC